MRYLLIIILLSIGLISQVMAEIVDTWQFSYQQTQARAVSLAKQLRCPQCQNQNLVESTSPIARDLRLEVYKMVEQGQTDQQIIQVMTDRFGDFVLYKPRLTLQTLLLWFGPGLFIVIAISVIFYTIYRRNQSSVTLSIDQRNQLNRLLGQQSESPK